MYSEESGTSLCARFALWLIVVTDRHGALMVTTAGAGDGVPVSRWRCLEAAKQSPSLAATTKYVQVLIDSHWLSRLSNLTGTSLCLRHSVCA